MIEIWRRVAVLFSMSAALCSYSIPALSHYYIHYFFAAAGCLVYLFLPSPQKIPGAAYYYTYRGGRWGKILLDILLVASVVFFCCEPAVGAFRQWQMAVLFWPLGLLFLRMYLSALYAQGLQIVIDDQGITLIYLTGECGYLNYDDIHSVSETLLLRSWFDEFAAIASKQPYATEYYGTVLHLKNGGSVNIWTEGIEEDNLHRLLNAMKNANVCFNYETITKYGFMKRAEVPKLPAPAGSRESIEKYVAYFMFMTIPFLTFLAFFAISRCFWPAIR